QVGQCERSTVHDGPLEQSPRAGRDEMSQDRKCAGGLARDRDVLGVAAKTGNVALDPSQGRLLVHLAVVAGRTAGGCSKRRVREPAEGAQTVVDGDYHYTVLGQLHAVEASSVTLRPAPAVDPDDHWSTVPVFAVQRCGVDVEEQTVFAERRRRKRRQLLRATGTELRSVTDTLPWGHRVIGTPARPMGPADGPVNAPPSPP